MYDERQHFLLLCTGKLKCVVHHLTWLCYTHLVGGNDIEEHELRTHFQTHSQTHSHSHKLSHTLTHCKHSHTLLHTYTNSHSLSHTPTHSHPHTPALPHSHTPTLPHTPTHSHTLPHTPTHSHTLLLHERVKELTERLPREYCEVQCWPSRAR